MNLSRLGHTWIFDIDGTLVEHNGYINGNDRLLKGVKKFWNSIPDDDCIILLSARSKSEEKSTLDFFDEQQLRFDYSIFGLPKGERIILNDMKPLGLKTAVAINLSRDVGLEEISFQIMDDL